MCRLSAIDSEAWNQVCCCRRGRTARSTRTSRQGAGGRWPSRASGAPTGCSTSWIGPVCAGAAERASPRVANGDRLRPVVRRWAIVTLSPTVPRASRGRSRIGRCCARTRTRCSKACRWRRRSWAHARRSSPSRPPSHARSRRSSARCRRWRTRTLLCDAPVSLIAGPEEYLFGEEKALLEVIEGNDPMPRWLPPYVHGLFATTPQEGWSAGAGAIDADDAGLVGSNPTLVTNVETLANVLLILTRGSEWYRTIGTRRHAGPVDLHRRGRCRSRGLRRDRTGHDPARGHRPRRRRSGTRSAGQGGVVGGVESR